MMVASMTACGAGGVLSLAPVGAILPAGSAQSRSAAPAAAATSVVPTQAAVVSSLDTQLEALYARVNPSVVNITVVLGASQSTTQNPILPRRRNSPLSPTPNAPQAPGTGVAMAEGTGFVYDAQGDIVTNNHVVEGATKITVAFADGVEAAATVVGASPAMDLAVIKVSVDASELHPLPMGESDGLKVGQSVVAIGNPFGQPGSMSTGIVSGLGRLLADGGQTASGQSFSIPDIVQTDAAINPGNSGGPLLDLAGNVIAVNTAIDSPVRGSAGVGYAIPSDIVAQVVPVLIASGSYQTPYLGISGVALGTDLDKAMNLPAQQKGVLVVDVVSSGPADKAGLKASSQAATVNGLPVKIGGDVIVSVNGQTVNQFDDLLSALVRHGTVGQAVTFGILRSGQAMNVQVTLGARPASQ
jgi:2-alkenal reductase